MTDPSSRPGPSAGTPSEHSPIGAVRSLVAGRSSPVARLAGVGLVLAGVVHLLGPRALLRTARVGYDRVLDVRFEPRANATRRVRLLGVAMVATGAHLARYGGVIPAERDG